MIYTVGVIIWLRTLCTTFYALKDEFLLLVIFAPVSRIMFGSVVWQLTMMQYDACVWLYVI